jgi:hypothetical protein
MDGRPDFRVESRSMIRKSGHRFSVRIMQSTQETGL